MFNIFTIIEWFGSSISIKSNGHLLYLSVISNDIVEKLELNYEKISAKSQYILNKFPSNETLTEEERVDISNQLIIFIKEELPQVLFNKISDNILN